MLYLLFLFISCTSIAPSKDNIVEKKDISFSYCKEKNRRLHSVHLVGSFNGWKKDLPMQYDERKKCWSIAIPLSPGKYSYQFLENELHWVLPPNDDPVVKDKYGSSNRLRVVQ